MDIRKVKKLIELIEESGVAEIEITEGEESVRISRHATEVKNLVPSQIAVATPAAETANAPAPPSVASDDNETHFEVASPMVGTFYSASSPDSEPFVKVGDHVKTGDTLCIIEAMKMMNPIESDVSGTIKSIRIKNGEPVEFGQTIIIIDQHENN
ncbi:MAG: acetyl-CoA carboxylase, biotin carboxyl carrier protein [Gammaproteobacteria bacterium]|nr:acetyl-CoA carboxylase, biotin carboxyl carrier protein [Gammaproteobacteria bacterium]|tara:strand:+ start:1065 stop:1529 length:465 start_codon:yes stop_codon:yes gene_type:complete